MFRLLLIGRLIARGWPNLVAPVLDDAVQLDQGGLLGQVGDGGLLRADVDRRTEHTRRRPQVFLNEAHARGAAQVRDADADLGAAEPKTGWLERCGQGHRGRAQRIVLHHHAPRPGVGVRAAHTRHAEDGRLHTASIAFLLQVEHRQVHADEGQVRVETGRGRAGRQRLCHRRQCSLRIAMWIGVKLRHAIG